jgi:hypothetical protein
MNLIMTSSRHVTGMMGFKKQGSCLNSQRFQLFKEIIAGWWFGTMDFYDFPFRKGNEKSSQLTLSPSCFRGVGGSTTNQMFSDYYWDVLFPLVS